MRLSHFILIGLTALLLALPIRADAGTDTAAYNAWAGLDYGSDQPADSTMPDTPALDNSVVAGPDVTHAEDALPSVPAADLRPRGYARTQQDPAAQALAGTAMASTANNLESDQAAVQDAVNTPSRIEQFYDGRLSVSLQQFGYALFNPARNGEAGETRPGMPAGAVQDDFVLSDGDRIDVTFRGQKSSQDVYAIDAKGQLLIPDMQPLTAAGRTIGQIRAALEADAAMLPNEQIFVSLDTVRQIDVLVVGHVRKPGRQTLTVFDTVLDALQDAGGIGKDGSLRHIKLIRAGNSTVIDLYGLLASGNARMDLSLRDGDRLIVPPVGSTVAVSGAVKRPGIYELSDGNERLSLNSLLDLAGGLLAPGEMRTLRLGLTTDGRETVQEIATKTTPVFGNGDILSVEPATPKRTGTVEISGDTRQPGLHALATVPTLAALLGNARVFGPGIYPLIGAIERQDKDQMTKQLIPFLPLQVVRKSFNRELQDGDIVHLFSRDDILALQTPDRDLPAPAERPEREALNQDAPDPVLMSWLKERSIFVRGSVRQPGAYPIADGATLASIIAVAGGLTLQASPQDIEITSGTFGDDGSARSGGTIRRTIDLGKTDADSVVLDSGDSVRVNPKARRLEENSVLLAGQVVRPGRYDLLPGDRFSDLLKRAGGLTQEAYPAGAIFSRESERKAEEQRFRAEARNLEVGLAASLNGKNDKNPNADQIAAVEQLVGQLKNAEGVGRITVEADPDALATDPSQDILLESGDRIFVPQRPLTVRVAGEILSPASLQFRKDKDAREYVLEAGGFTYNADKDRTFVLYPDGSAKPLDVGSWSHSAAFIPPGSTVIVPRDPKPFDFLETARDVTQILSNLAVTGIFVDDLHNGN